MDPIGPLLGAGEAFVGRRAELAVLEAARAETLAGKPQLLLISGPPGIGKSALVTNFLNGAGPLTVRRAGGDEFERSRAYGLVDQLLGPTLRSPPRSPRTDPMTLGSRLLDELAPPSGSDGLLLVIDDIHWADEPSLQALSFALRRLRRDPIMTVLACRDDALDHLSGGLRRLFADEGRQICLAGLGDEDLVALSEALGRGPLLRLAARRLRRHTDGNPLHAVALLEQLGGVQLERMPESSLPAPRSFAGLVTAQLVRCSPAARELVSAASVLGQRCPLSMAIAVAGIPKPGDAVDEAVGAGLITLAPGTGELSFPHRLIRVAMYQDLAAGHRSRLHARAADLVGTERSALRHRIAACLHSDSGLAHHAAGVARRWAEDGAWAAAAEVFAAAARLTPDHREQERWVLDAVRCLLLVGDMAEVAAFVPQVKGFEHVFSKLGVNSRGRMAVKLHSLGWSAPVPSMRNM